MSEECKTLEAYLAPPNAAEALRRTRAIRIIAPPQFQR